MSLVKGSRLIKASRAVPHAHEWEMVSGFVLQVAGKGAGKRAEMLAPIAEALQQYGLDEQMLLAISADVEEAGEELRSWCLTGKMNCVNVKVHMNARALKLSSMPGWQRDWGYYVVRNIASSESDNLNALEQPCCYIDVHVFEVD